MSAEKEMELEIENINDAPHVKIKFPKLSISQDNELKLRINENYFADKDAINDPKKANI